MEEVGSFYRAIPVTDPPQFLQSTRSYTGETDKV